VPAAAVIQEEQVVFVIIGCKGCVDCFFFFVIKFLNKEQITLLLVVIRVGTYYKLSDGEQWYKRQNKT